jgi:class 3 adenylate cyclase/predicted ATPase
MQQITDWLKKLGMAEYTDRFVENRIDLSVLPDLTDQDPKDLGVLLGDRRKLLRAIRDLGSASAAATAPPTPVATDPTRRDDAERRQLTVMFTDLVGSTALSTQLDPEDMRSVIGAYHKCVAETVARFEGFVAKYMGDGVLIYFGYPQAHEDDAERAVRGGLALIEAVGELPIQEPLQVRIGVATGLVVVGDLVGSGEAQERGVVGETPNLAARLQGIAAPNTVVIAEGTRRLLGNLFELEDLGGVDLKGIAGSVPAWAALRASPVESRFEALHASGLTALVGRQEESELLLRRWARAKTGEGQVVLIAGEAGIGKSRLTAALLERLAAEPHTRLRYFCSPRHTDSALYPIIGQMERAAGLAHDDQPQTRLDKLDALLAQTSTSIEDLGLFAEMLSLVNDGRYPALELAPQQRRERTLKALVLQIGALTRQGPILMIFEDAHWIDPTSLEALGRVVDRIQTIRVLLIVTFRPEFQPPWIGQSHVTALTINRLTQREVGVVIDGVAGNQLLPAGIRQDIIERTDGIPLFVEEMTKAVLEAEGQGAVERTVTVLPSPVLAVPAGLHASLMARLDRLGPAKEVAQIGAAIGREFSYELIAAISPLVEEELRVALVRLKDASLVFQQGAPPHATFLFKHALVRDAAYGTMLRERRRRLHAQIAELLTNMAPELAELQPEVLGHHCTEAGLIEEAASYWSKAGNRSVARSALNEAVTQFTRALSQLETLPETSSRHCAKVKLQTALANSLMLVRGYSSPEAISAFEKARSMIEATEAKGYEPDDPMLQFSEMYGLWVSSYIGIDVSKLIERAKYFLTVAEKNKASGPLLVGHRLMATTHFMQGHFHTAKAYADQAVLLYARDEHRSLSVRFGQDIGATALAYLSWAEWHLGYADTAVKDAQKLLQHAREFGHAPTLLYALYHAINTETWAFKIDAARWHAEELIALAEEKDTQFWHALGTLARGLILSIEVPGPSAIDCFNQGLKAYRLTGSEVCLPTYFGGLAKTYAACGDLDRAWTAVSEAFEASNRTGEKWAEAELHRTAAVLALARPQRDADKTERHLFRSLTIAREQEAKFYELRAAMDLARLWRDQGKRQQAHDLLAPVYCWFTEGFDTLDLKGAKALLEQLKA